MTFSDSFVYAYDMPPIEWGWNKLKTVRETVADFVLDSDDWDDEASFNDPFIVEFQIRWKQARLVASERFGWEPSASIPCHCRVMWFPDTHAFSYAFVLEAPRTRRGILIAWRPFRYLAAAENVLAMTLIVPRNPSPSR